MSASQKKLFIAIRLPQSVIDRVFRIQQNLIRQLGTPPSIRLVAPEKLHLTLLFLGMVDVKATVALINALKRAVNRVLTGDGGAPEAPFIVITNLGAFPTTSNPRVIWIGARDPSGVIPRLAMTLRTEVVAGDHVKLNADSEKPFVPHITIAYPRRHISRDQRRTLSQTLNTLKTTQKRGVEIPAAPRDGTPGTRGNTGIEQEPLTDRRDDIAGCRVERISIMESIVTPSGSRYVERYGTDL